MVRAIVKMAIATLIAETAVEMIETNNLQCVIVKTVAGQIETMVHATAATLIAATGIAATGDTVNEDMATAMKASQDEIATTIAVETEMVVHLAVGILIAATDIAAIELTEFQCVTAVATLPIVTIDATEDAMTTAEAWMKDVDIIDLLDTTNDKVVVEIATKVMAGIAEATVGTISS